MPDSWLPQLWIKGGLKEGQFHVIWSIQHHVISGVRWAEKWTRNTMNFLQGNRDFSHADPWSRKYFLIVSFHKREKKKEIFNVQPMSRERKVTNDFISHTFWVGYLVMTILSSIHFSWSYNTLIFTNLRVLKCKVSSFKSYGFPCILDLWVFPIFSIFLALHRSSAV